MKLKCKIFGRGAGGKHSAKSLEDEMNDFFKTVDVYSIHVQGWIEPANKEPAIGVLVFYYSP